MNPRASVVVPLVVPLVESPPRPSIAGRVQSVGRRPWLAALPLLIAQPTFAPSMASPRWGEVVPVATIGAQPLTTSRLGTTGPTWVRESWTVRDGLPVNSINWLLQDRAGFIWAATYDGLVRFDGVRFTVYKAANSPGLPSNRLLRLRETRDGSLWLFSEQDHAVRLRDGVFTNFTRPSSNSNELIPAPFEEDSAGTIWLGSSDGLWTVKDDSVTRFPGPLGTLPVTGIVARRDGSLWVSTSRRGLYRVGNGGRQAQRIAVDPELDTATVNQLHEDGAGALWIATMEGMWTGRDRFARVELPRAIYSPFSWLDSPRDDARYAVTRTGLYRIADRRGELVDGRALTGTGIRAWVDDGSVWHASGAQVLRDGQPVFAIGDDSLPPRENPTAITTVLVDREGSIWLGTRAAGLHRLKPGIADTYGVPEGVGRNAQTVFARKDGSMWVGVWDEGVRRIDFSTGRATVAPMRPGEFGITNAIGEGADGSLLIGSGRGLHACDWAMVRCAVQGPEEYHRGRVLALHRDRRGTVWVGLSRRAVLRGDSAGWTALVDILPTDARSVVAIADTRDGAVWLGTSGVGLVRYHDGRATVITTRDGLPTDIIRSLHEDDDGWLWIGTGGGGLARLDPREWDGTTPAAKRRIVTLTSAEGLFDDVVHAILEDNFGRLWMSGNRGVSWIARSELAAYADGKIATVRVVGYDERDGMRNREANGGKQPAVAKGIDGRLWFPTQDGVVVFDPRLVRQDSVAPPLVVERVVAARGTPRIRTTVVRPIGASGAEGGAEVRLDVEQRDFQVEYTALTFLEPGNVRFRYRLEGYDSRWVDADRRRVAFYTKVPPGTYTFRVQAATSSGDWGEQGAALVVHVAPRVWETTLFRLTAALALVALLLWTVRRRLRLAGDRARELQSVVDERTRALRDRERELAAQNAQLAGLAEELKSLDHAKTRFFANVSHELRTPLTLTIGPLDDLRARTADDAQSTRLVDLASRNARRLLRLVNQILDVAKLEAGEMKLSPRPFDLAPFVRGLIAAFAPAADRGGIALGLVAPGTLSAFLDPDAVEKILTNLLSNALKFTPSGGRVTLTLVADGGDALFEVRDTGPGIPADQLAHVFERFYQVDESRGRTQPGTGIGLALVKELVELQRGTVTAASDAGGATFTVRLPLGAAPAATGDEAALLPPIDDAIVTAEHAPSDPGEQFVVIPADDDTDEDARPDLPTLLVVDDSEDLRHYVGDHFAARFRVVYAGDGAVGIAMARQYLPDIIVSDVMMPGTDGLALVRTLRASPETDFLPVILLTAQAEDEQRLAGLERGADDYLVKPFEMRELDVRVRNIIASRQRLRARYVASAPRDPVVASEVDGAPPPDAASVVRPAPAIAAADRLFADRLLAAMRAHVADPDFGVGELADIMATDRSHLFRRAKQLLGDSPSALMRKMRLDEARRLLGSEDASVADVAYAVGFNSVSHFSQAFSAHFGVSPAAFRDRRG